MIPKLYRVAPPSIRSSAQSPGVLRLLGLGILLLLLGVPLSALAHSFSPWTWTLQEQSPGRFLSTLQPPLNQESVLVLTPQLPSHCRELPLPTTASKLYDCGPQGLQGSRLGVASSPTAVVEVLVILHSLSQAPQVGVIHSGQDSYLVPAADSLTREDSAPPSIRQRASVITRYLHLGALHIATGADHLLFLLGLQWLLLGPGARAAQSHRRKLPLTRLLTLLTAFTLAHSLTLAAAALHLVSPPVDVVEPMIALSILFLARELLRPHAQSRRAYPALLAFLFGLLHGLGFAGALSELGLPSAQLLTALLSFNLGVELGQLGLCAFALPLLLLLRNGVQRWPALQPLPAYALGAVAAAWTLQRLTWLL